MRKVYLFIIALFAMSMSAEAEETDGGTFVEKEYPFYYDSQWCNEPMGMIDGQYPFTIYTKPNVVTWAYNFNLFTNESNELNGLSGTGTCTIANYAGVHMEFPEALAKDAVLLFKTDAQNYEKSITIPAGQTSYDIMFGDNNNIASTENITYIRFRPNDNTGFLTFNKCYLINASKEYVKGYMRNSGHSERIVSGYYVSPSITNSIIADAMTIDSNTGYNEQGNAEEVFCGIDGFNYLNYKKAVVKFGEATKAAVHFGFTGDWDASDPAKFTEFAAGQTEISADITSSTPYELYMFGSDEQLINVAGLYFVKDAYQRPAVADRYYTVCFDKPAIPASDVTVYSITGINAAKTEVALSEVTDRPLVAGTPYLYTCTGTKAEFVINNATAVVAGAANGLKGSFSEIDVPANSYILYNNEWVKSGASAIHKIRSNHAYLDLGGVPVTSSLGAKRMMVSDGESTGINSVEDINNAEDAYYTLGGQRVMNPTKGVYIKNGKKVIIK